MPDKGIKHQCKGEDDSFYPPTHTHTTPQPPRKKEKDPGLGLYSAKELPNLDRLADSRRCVTSAGLPRSSSSSEVPFGEKRAASWWGDYVCLFRGGGEGSFTSSYTCYVQCESQNVKE